MESTEVIKNLIGCSSTELRSKVKEIAVRNAVEELAPLLLNKVSRGCDNCRFDNLIELILYFKNKKDMKKESKYKLRKGVVLQFGGANYTCSVTNITDELAEYHLYNNPECRKFFDDLPADLDEQLKAKYEKKAPDSGKAKKADKAKKTDKTEKVDETGGAVEVVENAKPA